MKNWISIDTPNGRWYVKDWTRLVIMDSQKTETDYETQEVKPKNLVAIFVDAIYPDGERAGQSVMRRRGTFEEINPDMYDQIIMPGPNDFLT